MSNDKIIEMAKKLKEQGKQIKEQGNHLKEQSDFLYESVKYIEEVSREVGKTKEEILKISSDNMKVSAFLIDFYNEYRDHDALTMAQTKELKQAQHEVTSTITKILCPSLPESHKRGNQYLVEWNRVNKGIWSIFKRNVNGINIPYDRTPKIKFNQALEYMKSLTVADYLAYRDERWSDIKKFTFNESLIEEKISIEKIIGTEKPQLRLVENN